MRNRSGDRTDKAITGCESRLATAVGSASGLWFQVGLRVPSGAPAARRFLAISRSPGTSLPHGVGLTLALQVLAFPADVGLGGRGCVLVRGAGAAGRCPGGGGTVRCRRPALAA